MEDKPLNGAPAEVKSPHEVAFHVTVARAVQPENADAPTEVTAAGIVTAVRPLRL